MGGDRLLSLGGDTDGAAVLSEGKWLNYGELESRARRIAAKLLALGVKAGDRFAFLMPNSPNTLCCYIACARTGIVGVPISQRITPSEFRYQLKDPGSVLLLYGSDFAPLVDEQRAGLANVRHFINESSLDSGPDALPTGVRRLDADARINGKSPFCVMYTGGTTGSSKAAIQTRESWVCCLESSVEAWSLSSKDRHLIALPMSHAAWFTAGAALQAGGTVTILRDWNPDLALDLVEQQRISTLNMVPTMLGDLLKAFEARPRNVRSVRLLTVAGSVLPIATYRRACAVFGEVIGNIYGLTEAAGPVTFLLPSDMSTGKHESVGKPGKNIELAILDDCGNPTSGLATGEIGLAGPQITTGYLEKPEETRDTFAGKWFLTGDIGKIDTDGFVYVVDRRKDMIKTGGFNVYPSEVEQVLYKQPEVLECAVLGMPDIKWTEAVHAAVVLRPGFTGSESHLISRCRKELAGYKVPKEVHFVPKLPRTRFGKFDKAQLKRDLWSNASDQEHG